MKQYTTDGPSIYVSVNGDTPQLIAIAVSTSDAVTIMATLQAYENFIANPFK